MGGMIAAHGCMKNYCPANHFHFKLLNILSYVFIFISWLDARYKLKMKNGPGKDHNLRPTNQTI